MLLFFFFYCMYSFYQTLLNKDIVIQVYIVYSSHACYHLLSHQSLFLLIPFSHWQPHFYTYTPFIHMHRPCVCVCIHEHYLYVHGLCMCIKSRNNLRWKHRDEITSYDSLLLHTWIPHCKGLCRHAFQKAPLSEKKRRVASVLHSRHTVKCLGSFSDMIILTRYSDWASAMHGLLLSLLC